MGGPFLDEEELEEQRRREEEDSAPPVITGAPAPPPPDVPPVASAPVGASQPAMVGAPPPMIPLAPVAHPDAPPVQPAHQLSPARQRLQQLIDQGAPPVQPLHGAKKFFDALGKAFVPGLEERLRYAPQAEYNRERAEAEENVANDKILHPEPPPKADEWTVVPGERGPNEEIIQENKSTGQTRYASGITGHSTKQPNLTPPEQVMHDLLTGDNGKPRMNEATGKPYTATEAFQETQRAPKEKTPNFTATEVAAAKKLGIKPEDMSVEQLNAADRGHKESTTIVQPPRQLMMVPQPDGSMKAVEVTPGSTVPKGAVTSGGLSKTEETATADEKRRADLGTNMEENLKAYEDIVRRRPELFGPIAGRMTAVKMAAGSSDPDIAALKVIKEFAGMAAVGTHAMRNAQHAKVAADAMMDLNDDPQAILDEKNGTLTRARASIKTFMQPVEAQHGNMNKLEGSQSGGDLGAAPAGKAEGSTGTMPDGTKVVVKNKRLVKQ